jgi:hypothetical protein
MSVTRPLPESPNLEFERKQAKLLLKELRAGEKSASARMFASHPHAHDRSAAGFTLADTQLTLAREYGFASWPRLRRYFQTADRQRHRVHSNPGSVAGYEYDARAMIEGHAKRRTRIGRLFAEFTPRFFGLTLDEVFSSAVTEDEARHAVARAQGFASWSVLVARATDAMEPRGDGWDFDAHALLFNTLRRADLGALKRVIAQHPALLHPTPRDNARNSGILNAALAAERHAGVEAMRPIMAWLASQGHDVAARRHAQLCGSSFNSPDDVRSMLERGADPAWIAPNGLSVLEHALLRYRNGECVDLIAQRVTLPRAFWIAAGLGNIAAVATFLDSRGKPTPAARAQRPDFIAVGPFGWPSHADAGDETVLFEAAYVAGCNGRVEVLEYLLSRGLSVNSMVWDVSLLALAVDFNWLPQVIECLVSHGADVHLRSPTESMDSPHEMARMHFTRRPWDEACRRTAASCGVNVAAVAAERERRPIPTLSASTELQRVLRLAGDDASRQGQTMVGMEHVFFGLLRAGGHAQYFLSRGAFDDFTQFRDAVLPRVRVSEPDENSVALVRQPDVARAFHDAVQLAADRHDEAAHTMHLLDVLVRPGGGLEPLITQFGGTLSRLREMIDSTMQYDNAQ